MAAAAEPPGARLARLAKLHQKVSRASVDTAGADAVLLKIGELGGRIEGEAKLTQLLAKASAPLGQRLGALLNMATGETAPPGPAAERAKAEVLKLVRLPEARAELANTPAAIEQLKMLMHLDDAA